MYPGIVIEYNDQSDFKSTVPVSEVRNQPLMATVFTSDKGPEDWQRVSGKEFFDIYGNSISFAKHGQPLLQAAMTINAGAKLLCKRIVASDATLANIGIVATLKTVEAQAKDANGDLLYIDEEGNEVTTVTDTPVMESSKEISYSTKYATGAKTMEDAKKTIEATLSDGDYLLYVIADNGRGTSKKRIKIVPNYRLSKSISYTLYTLTIIENGSETESISFNFNPDLVISGENISLASMVKTHSSQIECINVDSGMAAFIDAISEATSLSIEQLNAYDVLFGCTNRGEAITGIALDKDGVDLQYNNGQVLVGGSNGVLGDYPFTDDTDSETGEAGPIRAEYIKQAVAAINGEYDTCIYNVDQHMIDAFVDANYPAPIKRAIEGLATFREDFIYFRDMGLGKTDISLIEAAAKDETKNMFCASYCQSYDVIDPYSKKQISVTIGYDLAQKLVAHCNNGRILPTAGIKHNMILTNAIYGTLSFSPTICPEPEGNQKEKLEDLKVNYASYIDNQLVIESLYTSYDRNSQWSYINNVMGIQEVVKAIRTRCPVIRYTFIDGEDLERYKADIEEVIAPFTSNFKQLTLDFATDSTYSANKIFYAVLKAAYNDFVQTEWFKVTALSVVDAAE